MNYSCQNRAQNIISQEAVHAHGCVNLRPISLNTYFVYELFDILYGSSKRLDLRITTATSIRALPLNITPYLPKYVRALPSNIIRDHRKVNLRHISISWYSVDEPFGVLYGHQNVVTSYRALPQHQRVVHDHGRVNLCPVSRSKYSVDEPFGVLYGSPKGLDLRTRQRHPVARLTHMERNYTHTSHLKQRSHTHISYQTNLFKLVLRWGGFWYPLWVTKTSWSPLYGIEESTYVPSL